MSNVARAIFIDCRLAVIYDVMHAALFSGHRRQVLEAAAIERPMKSKMRHLQL